jgi:RluA family pseudouridine synthase
MLEILHEDTHVVVVNKPAGLSTTAPKTSGPTLEALAREYLRATDSVAPYVGLVHRLDRPVSGVLLIAKTRRDARRLSRQFEGRLVCKEYWAVVEGTAPEGGATWEDWLCREDTGLGRVQACSPGTPRAQHARTRVEVGPPVLLKAIPPGWSWLRLRPETGRMHQLRVQASRRGHPIVGDTAYGSGVAPGAGIALHARSLGFRHPAHDLPMTIRAPVPPEWAGWGIEFDEQAGDSGRNPPGGPRTLGP